MCGLPVSGISQKASSFLRLLFISFYVLFSHPLASRTAKQPQSILFVKARHPESETPEALQQAADGPDSLYYSEMVLATSQNMAFGRISGWLSLVKMLFFQLSYQHGGIWPSELCVGRRVGGGGGRGGGDGSYQNKLQTAACVKDVLLVVVTAAVCDSFSVCLSHTACCSSRCTYSAVCPETGWNYGYRLTHKMSEYILCTLWFIFGFQGRRNKQGFFFFFKVKLQFDETPDHSRSSEGGQRPSQNPSSNSSPPPS